MACMTMSATQQSRSLRRPVRVAWPRARLSRLQRALVAVFVVGALALASAVLLAVSNGRQAPTPGRHAEPARVELPRVVIQGRRLPPVVRQTGFGCPVPSDPSAADCPRPLDTLASQEF